MARKMTEFPSKRGPRPIVTAQDRIRGRIEASHSARNNVSKAVALIAAALILSTCNNERCQCKTADGSVAEWSAKNCNDKWDEKKCVAPHYSMKEDKGGNTLQAWISIVTTELTVAPWTQNEPMLVATSGPIANLAEPLDCVRECDNPGSYWCQYIPEVADSTINASIDKFAERLNSSSGRISKADIMSDFDVTKDPCERSDTFLDNGILTNEGGICMFSAKVKIGGTSPFVALVQLPEILSARVKEGPGSDLTFDFVATGAELPTLKLNRFWDEDYGGAIRKIHYRNQSLILSTERGCLKID